MKIGLTQCIHYSGFILLHLTPFKVLHRLLLFKFVQLYVYMYFTGGKIEQFSITFMYNNFIYSLLPELEQHPNNILMILNY